MRRRETDRFGVRAAGFIDIHPALRVGSVNRPAIEWKVTVCLLSYTSADYYSFRRRRGRQRRRQCAAVELQQSLTASREVE